MIEPCCCENQLPEALREQKGRAIVATSGDVLINHWYKAIGYQAGTTHKLRLCIHQADIKLLRHIRLWMQRGWTTEVQITTCEDQREMIAQELGDSVSIATDGMMQSELMAMEGEDGLVMIVGPMDAQAQLVRSARLIADSLIPMVYQHVATRGHYRSSFLFPQCLRQLVLTTTRFYHNSL